jgi:hypothetical protein
MASISTRPRAARARRRVVEQGEQIEGYAALVDLHADLFAKLYGAILGQAVSFTSPCEKIFVWPPQAKA